MQVKQHDDKYPGLEVAAAWAAAVVVAGTGAGGKHGQRPSLFASAEDD